MRAVDLITRKRDGAELREEEIAWFVRGVTDGSLADYQASALLMAIFFRGLTGAELTALADAMLESGVRVDLSGIAGAKVDKHSTGGVGDKVSICLAPLVAACGVRVPMVSGRGLGHTGGTLDKLQSIPGFRIDLPLSRYRELVASVGACLIGQTAEIAPADRKLYALRDVTGTVESIPLIAASIMSKKLAEGIDALVLDVKVGRGAFMKTPERARELALALIDIGRRRGTPCVALLSDMDQPLGLTVGNALEVREAVEILEGRGPADLRELTLALAEEMLRLGGAGTAAECRSKLSRALGGGAAREKLLRIAEAQGGDPRTLENGGAGLPQAPERVPLRATLSGVVRVLDAESIGRAAMALGAGRAALDDAVDPAVGIVLERKRGDAVAAGEVLCVIHARGGRGVTEALALAGAAYDIGEEGPEACASRPLILDRIA